MVLESIQLLTEMSTRGIFRG